MPTIYVLSKKLKKYQNFYLKIIAFTAVKHCSILHRRVCAMFWEKGMSNRPALESAMFETCMTSTFILLSYASK